MYSVIDQTAMAVSTVRQPEHGAGEFLPPPSSSQGVPAATPFSTQQPSAGEDSRGEAPGGNASSKSAVVLGKNPWVLKRLTQRHRDMVTLSLQGLSREKVGEYCGCTPEYVTMINKQPLARAYIAELESHMDLRLRGLYERSLDALQAGLTSPKISDKLAAAQIQLRAIGKTEPGPDDSKQTAEDVVSAMLIQGTNVQVNVHTGGK